jgi:hypothetical protein
VIALRIAGGYLAQMAHSRLGLLIALAHQVEVGASVTGSVLVRERLKLTYVDLSYCHRLPASVPDGCTPTDCEARCLPAS